MASSSIPPAEVPPSSTPPVSDPRTAVPSAAVAAATGPVPLDRAPTRGRGTVASARLRGLRRVLFGLAGVALILVVWQLVAVAGVFGAGLPAVPAVATRLGALLAAGTMWTALGQTLAIALVGLVASAVIGVLLGVLIGRSRVVRAATLVVVEFLKPIPPIVVLPLMVLVLGPTTQMAWVLVVIGCALSITIQTIAGVEDTDPVALATARSYGLGSGEILWRIVLPSALPFIGTAMRLAAPAALVVAVVAGLLGGAPGLGSSLYQAQAAGDFATLWALVVILGVLGVIVQSVSAALEHRVLAWHPAHREVHP